MLIARRTVLALALSLVAPLPAMAADKPLKIGVSSGPYADILRETAKLAAQEGLAAEVVEFADWTQINEALQRGDIDANNFQHAPFLDSQKKQRGYAIEALDASIVVPVGLYAQTYKTAAEIPAGATIAIPNDPSNIARALSLLQKAGLIKLKPGAGVDATVLDVAENPRNLKLVEINSSQIPRSLPDVAAGVVTIANAFLAKLDPKKALVLEDAESRWTLVWAVRQDRKDDPRIRRFIALYRSQPIKDFVLARFDGSVFPTW